MVKKDKLNKNTASFVIIFIASIVVAELHQLFSKWGTGKWSDGSYDASNLFFIPLPFPISLQYYIHDIGDSLRNLLWAVLGLKLSKGKGTVIRGIVFIWFAYCCIDIILFLICYKRFMYDTVLILIGGAITTLFLIRKI